MWEQRGEEKQHLLEIRVILHDNGLLHNFAQLFKSPYEINIKLLYSLERFNCNHLKAFLKSAKKINNYSQADLPLNQK